MIRITRGDEPAELPAARERGLTRIRQLIADDPGYRVKSDDIPRSYRCAAEPLREAQGRKCCYCENRIEPSHNDVEHYRPKTQYWWLSWTWSNLLFACRQCNQPPNKHDQFPLAEESTRLHPEQPAPGGEQPLLIDPAGPRDPLDSIEFKPFKIAGRTRWIPVGKQDDRCGMETIRTLGLDRDGLLEHYACHINEIVRPRIVSLQRVLATGDARDIQQAWNRLVRSCLRQSAPFAALSHDFIADQVSVAVRTRWQLHLPRPPIE